MVESQSYSKPITYKLYTRLILVLIKVICDFCFSNTNQMSSTERYAAGIHQATQHSKLKTELQGSSFRFVSAIENEFNAFNLQLKARPRKLRLNNISFKNSSFHYNAKESTKKPKQVSASEREQAKRKCVLRLLL